MQRLCVGGADAALRTVSRDSSVAAQAAAGAVDILYVSPERAVTLGAAFFAGILQGRCA